MGHGPDRRAWRLQLLRGRPDQRGRQLRGPLGAGPGHGRPRRRDLGGRAGRRPHRQLRRARRRGEPAGRRARLARRDQGRRGGDLHAERGRGVHRRARLQPDRRHLHDPVLRLRPGRRAVPAGGGTRQGRDRAGRVATGAAGSSRCSRRCAPRAARSARSSTRSWSTAPGAACRSKTARSPTPTPSSLAPEGTPAVPLEANDPAFLIFTSGTEARPKGVVHSVAGFLLGTWANVRWQIGPETGRRLLGGRRRGLADLPDPGRRRRAGQRHDRGLLRGRHGHAGQRALLRDLREAPRHQGARRAHAAAHAAQVRRRAGRRAPAAGPAAGHRPGRAARRRHVHLGEHAPGRRGARRQRLRPDRDRLDLDLSGRGRGGAQARLDRHRGPRACLRHRRRRRPAGAAGHQGEPGADPAVPHAGADRVGRPGALPARVLLPVPRLLLHQRRGGARRRRSPVGARPGRRRDQRGRAPHLDAGDRGHRDRASRRSPRPRW